MKQPRRGDGILAGTEDLRSKGRREKSLEFVGHIGWRNCFSLVLCRSFDLWTVSYAQKAMAAIRRARYPCRQVNSHCHSPVLRFLCTQRMGYLWRRRWKRHPLLPTEQIGQSHSLSLPTPLPLKLIPLPFGPPLWGLDWGQRCRDKHWVIPLEELILGCWR